MMTLNLTAGRAPWRLMAATLVLAAAATVAQTAFAQPFGHGRGHHGGGHADAMAAGGGGFGMMMAPHRLHRLLDDVGASAEQRAQIQQIVRAAHADMKAQHDAGRGLREQAMALFVQPNVDARAAEALRQQMLARHDQASQRMLQAMLDVSRVLTPEQRRQIGERIAARKAMMQRHRAERAASGASAPRR